jgi:hypothetical protein
MFHQFSAVVSGNMAAFYSGAGEYGSAYDLFVTRLVGESTYTQLGSSQFPAVIAASDSVREKIENDYFWKYRPSDANGYVNIDGESFYRGQCGEYAIYVNPSGMCDWAEGGLESPLEAYWIAYKFSGAYTLDEIKVKTAEFYSKFLNVTLSDEQLKNIFGNRKGDTMGNLKVFSAGVAARFARQAAERYQAEYGGAEVELEFGGSTAGVKKLIAGEKYDVMILADSSNIDELLMPEYADGYFIWGGNEMVLAGNDITSGNWKEKLLSPESVITHHDPYGDPSGYRAVMAMQLADRVEPVSP